MKKTNLWKALFSVVMSIFMVMAMLPSMIFVVYSLDGRGTEIDPYLIGSYDDLLEFARLVNEGKENQYAELINDIDAQKSEEESKKWTPIGEEENVYKGIFNGNKKTIRGLHVETDGIAGLFGEISSDAVVENVILENSYIKGNFVGGLVVYNKGKIFNCRNAGVVMADVGDENYAGGVAGVNYDGSVVGCRNVGEVMSIGNWACAGGVVVDNIGEISGCSNTGNVKVEKTNNSSEEEENSLVGGVVALNEGKVASCNNIGTVIIKGNDIYAGGVVGSNEEGITEDSYSIGEINIEEGDSFIGGVFGLAKFSDGASGDGETQNFYYDCNRCSAENPIGDIAGEKPDSIKGLTTDQMTGTGEGRAETEMVGFKKGDGETSVWYFHDDDKADVVGQKYAYYPNLEEYTSADAWIPRVKIFYGTFNGGEGSAGTMPPEKFYDRISKKLFENQFMKAGYTFLNWKDSDGTLYENQKEVMLKEDTEFIAQWKGKPYKVKYNLNGGKMSTPEKIVVWNGKVLPEENPTRGGYDFTGWTYNGTIVAEDRTYEDLVSDDNVESIELTAQWQLKDSFTVKRTDEKLTDNNEELQSEVVIATPVNDVKTSDSYDLDMLFALIAIILVSGVGLLGMREKRKVK